MKLSSEVVEKICGMDHLSGKERTERLGCCEKIASQIARVQRAIQIAEEEHAATMKKFDGEIEAIRVGCRHEFTKYFPDASGNNDSFSECQVCGAEVGKSKLQGLDRP